MATVTQVNSPPTFTGQIQYLTLTENGPPPLPVPFGISAGGNATQIVTVNATSSNPALIANPGSNVPGALAVNYINGSTTGTLSFTPVANANGVATITLTATDSGGTSLPQTFTVTVTPVDTAPTFTLGSPTPAAATLESNVARPQSVPLSAIVDGPGDPVGQTLFVTATTNNTALINNLTVNYTSPKTTGSLAYTINPFLSGTANITVTVTDAGGASVSEVLTVNIAPVNQVPTLGAIQSPGPIPENTTGTQTVNLTNITAGLGDSSQALEVYANTDNPTLLSGLTVHYTPGSTTGTITYTVAPISSGRRISTSPWRTAAAPSTAA